MKEQSHKAEMSAALRGDFQRLRARGVDAALVPQDDHGPDEESAEWDREYQPTNQVSPKQNQKHSGDHGGVAFV